MRKKFTSLLLMLMAFVSTAMADLTQNYYMNTNFWTAVEESSIPEGVTTVLSNAKVGETSVKTDAGVIQWACNEITVTATGDVTVTFTHNGGNHMLNMLGVDIVSSEGNVVASDYHYDSAGSNPQKTAYTLTGLTEGSVLTLRCFVYDNTGTNDRTNSAQGYYTVTNVTGEAIVVLKPAVDLANGMYIFREVSGDVVRYDGTNLARGVAFPDATDNNHIFTITKGNNGFYTIQTVDGKYVTYSGTGNGTALTTSEEADATDANKWWSIREGSSSGLRIIVPSTNDVFNAPGWNYAISVGGYANKAVGLWNSNGANSNWYIVGAPAFSLPDATGGYAQLKIANTLAYSDGTNIVKATENNSSLFKFTKGEGSHFTIQDANDKYLIYTTTDNHLLTLVDEASATDANKWWFVTFDRANTNKALDIFPKQDSYSDRTYAFNWSQNTNTKLGFWGANDNNSYCSVEFFVTPEVGSFVAFKSAATHDYCKDKYVHAIPTSAVRTAAGGYEDRTYNHTSLIFDDCAPAVTPSAVFEVMEGTSPIDFKLKNVHTQEYVKSFANGAEHMGAEGDAVAISFKSLGGGQTAVYGANNGSPMHAQQAYGVIVTWDGEAGSASAWSIEEVEVFSHTLSIGEIGWSSLILGFNATIPQDVEVYAVSEVGKNTVTIEQITGVLPANTAVLVNAAKGDYEFTYTAETASVSSELEGTLYDNNVVGDAYVLSAPNSNVGLYKATKNQLDNTAFKNNANKAYLPVVSNAPMFSFNRGEGTTSIDKAQLTMDNVVIYDLLGRRVEKMEKGIYIVNGKKIIK